MDTKRKFNIVDVIIILAVLLIIGVSVFRMITKGSGSGEMTEKDITYTVYINGLDTDYVNSISSGDALYYADKEIPCGVISEINAEYFYETISENNDSHKVINPSKVNIKLKVNTKARISDELLYIGENTYISEGQKLEFYTDTMTFTGIIAEFNETQVK